MGAVMKCSRDPFDNMLAQSWLTATRPFFSALSLLFTCARASVHGGGTTHVGTRLCGVSAVAGRQMVSGHPAMSTLPTYETLRLTQPKEHVVQVEINRPEKRNAMNQAFWREMVECFNYIADDSECRAVVVSGAGKVFSSGIDLMDMSEALLSPKGDDTARTSWHLRKFIQSYQETFTVIEKCTKPVIAAIQGACVGGGVDMVTACDIRFCTQDAWFQVKEVDIGLAADVGTLQRLPKVIGSRSLVCDLVYTGRKMMSDEAKSSGLVSRVFPDKVSLMEAALQIAEDIANKSPVAVQGSKVNLVYSRDHSVRESLEYMATWNMAMLQTDDIMKSATAVLQKKNPKETVFSKL